MMHRNAPPRISAILATYNRWETTADSLLSLQIAAEQAGVGVSITVADASSPDGTGEKIRRNFKMARVIQVPDSYYWAQGMRAAWEVAVTDSPDYILWLNDDVRVDRDALLRLISTSREMGGAVVVGAQRSPLGGSTTYTGYGRGRAIGGVSFPRVEPREVPQDVWAFNGNLVLTPRAIDSRVGGFPKDFGHGMADYAYGLRCRRRGLRVVLAAGTLGVCESNAGDNAWTDPNLSPRQRLTALRSPKGLPFREWLRFCWEFGGLIGLVSAVKPYVIAYAQAAPDLVIGAWRSGKSRA